MNVRLLRGLSFSLADDGAALRCLYRVSIYGGAIIVILVRVVVAVVVVVVVGEPALLVD